MNATMKRYPTTHGEGLNIAIEPGDFIKAVDCPMCMGIVLQPGSVPFGKFRKRIQGYMVSTANGSVDFIDQASAVLIAPSEEHFARLAARAKQMICPECGTANNTIHRCCKACWVILFDNIPAA